MIVNLFRHTQAISILGVLALCILLWVGVSFQDTALIVDSSNPLFNYIINPITKYGFLERILVSGLVFWQCIYINKILVGQKIFSTNTFYPAFFYFILISFWPQSLHLSAELFAITFFLLAINKTLQTYLSNNAYSKVFELSFYSSLAVLIHPPFFVFLPIIWIGMSIFSQGEWRHWLLSILALISPWFILINFNQYFKLEKLELANFYSFLVKEQVLSSWSTLNIVAVVILIIVLLISMSELLKSLSRKKSKARKSYIYLMWFLPFSFLYVFISPALIWHKLLIVAVPFTALISNYFYYYKKTNWLNFIGFIMLLFLCLNQCTNY